MSFWDLVVVFAAALAPALVYLVWIRGTERYRTVGWGPVIGAFVYGAVVATLVAAVIEAAIVEAGSSLSQQYPGPEFQFLNSNSSAGLFFLILVVAPFVEEGLKALGVVLYRSRMTIVADGPVFGASVGLGFGFFETFLYGVAGYVVAGLPGALSLVLVRSVSSVLLHGSSTAVFGYGYAESALAGKPGAAGRDYLAAVGMHALFNVFASLGVILIALGVSNTLGDAASYLGLALAIVFAIWAIERIRYLIQASDVPSLLGPRYRSPPPPQRSSRGPVPGRSS